MKSRSLTHACASGGRGITHPQGGAKRRDRVSDYGDTRRWLARRVRRGLTGLTAVVRIRGVTGNEFGGQHGERCLRASSFRSSMGKATGPFSALTHQATNSESEMPRMTKTAPAAIGLPPNGGHRENSSVAANLAPMSQASTIVRRFWIAVRRRPAWSAGDASV